MTRKRLLLYILLNIFISALVTGSMLLLYDRFGRPECLNGVGASSGVNISGVSGAGAVEDEILFMTKIGDDPVILTGWILRDSTGTAFTFPQITLHPGGMLQVHSGMGTDSVTDLYWNLTDPAWESGELVVLYDPQGIARAFYRIP